VLLTLGIVKVGDDDGLFNKVADNGANMVKGWNSLGCLDHTIERSVMKQWNDAQVKESFEKGKKVVTFFKSSTIGRSELAKVQEDLYGNKLGMLKQECKTRWSSTTISRWELTTGTLSFHGLEKFLRASYLGRSEKLG